MDIDTSVTIKTTSQLFEGYKIATKKTHRTERGDIIDLFMAAINPPRKEQGRKELTHAYFSWKFSQVKLSTPELYRFYMECKRNKNFSAYFWYKFKI